MNGVMETVEVPIRAVLEGVRRVGFGILEEQRDAESCPFPSCLTSALEYLGEDYGSIRVIVKGEAWRESNLYIHLMGASGAAFRLSWGAGWRFDNPSLEFMSEDPEEPYRRAFEAAGFEYQHPRKKRGRENELRFRQRIVESIAEHCRPVLGIGVVGPPVCSIITGFDRKGEVLLGWSYFQDSPDFRTDIEFEPAGYFRKRGWFEHTESLFLIGDRRPKPSDSEIHRAALEWALKVARTPATRPDRRNGHAAYQAWAEALGHDDEFPADEMGALRVSHTVHEDAVGTVAEGRWYAAQFLARVARAEPAMAEDLRAAAECFRAEHDLMWKIWRLVGGPGLSDEYARNLARPEVRREIVSVILQARSRNLEATALIERALER